MTIEETVLQQMQELTTLVKNHQADPATIDYEKLAAELAKQQTALIAAQPEPPIRRGEEFPAPGEHQAPIARGAFAGVKPIDLLLAKRVLDGQHRQGVGDPASKALNEELARVQKALTSTGSTAGDEVVPQPDMAAALWDDVFAATRVAGLLPPQQMTTDPMDISLSFGDVTFRKGTENTATTATDVTTGKSTLTTTELLGEVNWSYTLDEDAVISMAEGLRTGMSRNAAEYVDRFVLNADSTDAGTGNINLDDANPADDSYYLSAGQDGLRHLWLVDNTGQQVAGGGAALSDAMVQNTFKLLLKYYQDAQNDVAIVCDYSTFLKGFLKLTNVVTVDKYGPQATVVTGQLGSYMGVPIVPSNFHPLGESDGKCSTTAGSNVLGSLTAFNRRMWRLGYRRGVSIEVDRNIQTRLFIMVASFRVAVGCRGTRASAAHTAGALNLLVA